MWTSKERGRSAESKVRAEEAVDMVCKITGECWVAVEKQAERTNEAAQDRQSEPRCKR